LNIHLAETLLLISSNGTSIAFLRIYFKQHSMKKRNSWKSTKLVYGKGTNSNYCRMSEGYKVLLLGDAGVGKTSFLIRFVDGQFMPDSIATIGVDYKVKNVLLDDKPHKLEIWDTAGQERFRTITSSYYRGAHGVIIMYDVTNEKSFDSVKQWLLEVDRYATGTVNKIIVGNKSDLQNRVISHVTANQYADGIGLPLFEVSALDGSNVEDTFHSLLKSITNRMFNLHPKATKPSTVSLIDSSKESKSSGCC
jgi:Ras-related protein Rab-1A